MMSIYCRNIRSVTFSRLTSKTIAKAIWGSGGGGNFFRLGGTRLSTTDDTDAYDHSIYGLSVVNTAFILYTIKTFLQLLHRVIT